MSEIKHLSIENLVHRLNVIAQQRKELLDRLWTLEGETEKLRVELMGLLMGDKV